MSEEQVFATLGFDKKTDCAELESLLDDLINNSADYNHLFSENIESETLVDKLESVIRFNQTLVFEWFGGHIFTSDKIIYGN